MTDAGKTERVGEALRGLRSEVAKSVVGYDEAVTDLLLGLLANGHVLLEGVPGVAKTTLAKTFSGALGLTFRRVQFTQDLLPADITGHWFFNQKLQEFEVRKGPVFANVLLADEINRAPPKTQSALLEAMEERQVTIEGETFPLERPFMVVATMNPVDVEGVYRLPEAQLDRFMIRTPMGYLPPDLERRMLLAKLAGAMAPPKAAAGPWIDEARSLVRAIHVDEEVIEYLQAVCLRTRAHPAVTLGASPRAMEQMLTCARAFALLEGRSYVIPDDVKAVAPRILNHRIILAVDAEVEGKTSEAVVAECLASVPVPKGREAKRLERPT